MAILVLKDDKNIIGAISRDNAKGNLFVKESHFSLLFLRYGSML